MDSRIMLVVGLCLVVATAALIDDLAAGPTTAQITWLDENAVPLTALSERRPVGA